MSQLTEDYNKNLSPSSLASTAAATKTITMSSVAKLFVTQTDVITQTHYSTTESTTRRNLFSAATLLSPSEAEALTPNAEVVSLSPASMTEQQLSKLMRTAAAAAGAASATCAGSGRKVSRTMPSFKIMSYQNIIALLTVLVCGLVTVDGLKCYMCGQYNEGVGSITPCLNYSEQYAHLYLKECSKKSEKYCVKYVSELSIVRDCATECAEKEIWETQTYCCTEDGCNGASAIDFSVVVLILPLVIFVAKELMYIIKQQRR